MQAKNKIYTRLNTNAHLSKQDIEHGKIKIAKFASNTAETTAVSEFMSIVASSLTQQIGELNLGEKVHIDPKQMSMSEDGTRNAEIIYSGTKLKIEVDKN